MEHLDQEAGSTHWPVNGYSPPTEPVARLIYASMSLVEEAVLDEMRGIRAHALLNNEPRGLKVVLMSSCGWFAEWIEGPELAVEHLLARLQRDTRHHSLTVIHRSHGPARLVRPWLGTMVQAPEEAADFTRRVHALKRRHASGEQTDEPASVWLQLSAPPAPDMPLVDGAFPPCVMLLSARSTGPFDLLRWLAETLQRPLVKRRIAGSTDEVLDVASDYLDVPGLGSGGVRLLAHARKGLAMGTTHAFLPDHRAIALMLDADPERNARLVGRVLDACQQVRHAPLIIGLGAPAALDPALQARVENAGHAWQGVTVALEMPAPSDQWVALAPVLARL
jgi:hypothetical protein